MLKVAVVGAKGRMGQTVCQAVENATDLELVAALDQGDQINAETLAGADVAVEFTVPSQTRANVEAILAAGTHVVVGTTGWDEDGLNQVRQQCHTSGKHAIIAANYAVSAVLAMEFAAMAARWFESVEIIEAHHPNKVDAPSGTAIATAAKIAAAREQAPRLHGDQRLAVLLQHRLGTAAQTAPLTGGKQHGRGVRELALVGRGAGAGLGL